MHNSLLLISEAFGKVRGVVLDLFNTLNAVYQSCIRFGVSLRLYKT